MKRKCSHHFKPVAYYGAGEAPWRCVYCAQRAEARPLVLNTGRRVVVMGDSSYPASEQ